MTPQEIQNALRIKNSSYKFNPRFALAFLLTTYSILIALAKAEDKTHSGATSNCRFPFLCNDTYYLVTMNALICSNITEVIQQISQSGFNSSLTGESLSKIFYSLVNATDQVYLLRDATKLPQIATEEGLMQLFMNISNNYFANMNSTTSNVVVGLIMGCYGALSLIAVGLGIHSYRKNRLAQQAPAAVASNNPAPVDEVVPANNPAPTENIAADSESDLEMQRVPTR